MPRRLLVPPPGAEDESAPHVPRGGLRERPVHPFELRSQSGRVGVVGPHASLGRPDEGVGGSDDSCARVELVDESEDPLFVGYGDVEAIEPARAQGVDNPGEFARGGPQRLVRVRKVEGAVGRGVHRGTSRVGHGIAHDGKTARGHSVGSSPTAASAIGSVAVTLAWTMPSRTRT